MPAFVTPSSAKIATRIEFFEGSSFAAATICAHMLDKSRAGRQMLTAKILRRATIDLPEKLKRPAERGLLSMRAKEVSRLSDAYRQAYHWKWLRCVILSEALRPKDLATSSARSFAALRMTVATRILANSATKKQMTE